MKVEDSTGAMHQLPPIAVLWDYSHIWGLMAWRALRALGFPVRLVKGNDIAHGALFRKQGDAAEPACPLLVVPGGSARLKAGSLGEDGKRAIRDYVARGGRYLGFCGGAGLALSHGKGLELCPWARASYPERILHLISGHVQASPCAGDFTPDWQGRTPSLPVWWPGRFHNAGGDVEVLARYQAPDSDFWIADIALSKVPRHVFAEWRERYGINLTADFLKGSELIVRGSFGEGGYVLSYSHLETPESPDANRWLCHLLGKLTGARVPEAVVPAWDLFANPWEGEAGTNPPEALLYWLGHMRELMELGASHRLFFRRTSWLMGWQPGLPGMLCDNLLAAMHAACRLKPAPKATAYWQGIQLEFEELAEQFFALTEGYLLAVRLANTLLPTMPGAVDREGLAKERDRLFGHPMSGGGVLGAMQAMVDEYVFLCQES